MASRLPGRVAVRKVKTLVSLLSDNVLGTFLLGWSVVNLDTTADLSL